MELIIKFLKESISLWLEVSPYLLLGMMIAGLLHVFLGKDLISRQLGRGGISSIIKATIFGVPLPVCSCGVIPLASSIRKDGAHKSSVLSFLVSTPTTGVDSIAATYSLMGPLFAIFRPLGALISGITLGIIDYFFEGRKEKTKIIPKHFHHKDVHTFKIREFFRYAFLEIPQDIGKWLLLGTIIGGAIATFIPKETFAQYFSFPFDFAIVLLVGIPLYVCATGSIPIAVSLLYKGFSPGAALVFLIAGPATNAITLSFVRAKLGRKSFYIYLLSIIIVAVVLGLVFNYVWTLLGKDPKLTTGGGQMLPFYIKVISALVLFLIILGTALKKEKVSIKADYEISVGDIHCHHCKITLEGKLAALDGVEDVSVDVDKKTVKIKGDIDKKIVLDEIKNSGYTPEIDQPL